MASSPVSQKNTSRIEEEAMTGTEEQDQMNPPIQAETIDYLVDDTADDRDELEQVNKQFPPSFPFVCRLVRKALWASVKTILRGLIHSQHLSNVSMYIRYVRVCFLGRGESRTETTILKMISTTSLTVTIVTATKKQQQKAWTSPESTTMVMILMMIIIIVVPIVANIEKEKTKEERNETRSRAKRTRTPENTATMEQKGRKIMVTTIDRMTGTIVITIGESLTALIAGALTAIMARTLMASRDTMTIMDTTSKSLADTHRTHPAIMTEEATGIRTIAAILPHRARTDTYHETTTTRDPGVVRIIKIVIMMTMAVATIEEMIFRETARIRIEVSSQGTTIIITTGARIMALDAIPTDMTIPCHPEARIITQGEWKEGEN